MSLTKIINKDLLVLDGETTITEAATEMTERNFGVCLVKVNGEIKGIFSERDLLNRVVPTKKDPQKTSIKEVMSSPLVTVPYSTPPTHALDVMTQNRFRHLPVHDREQKIIGMLGIRDLMEQVKIYQTQLINSSKLASLGEMAGGVAHEINNPLAILDGYAHQISTLVGRSEIDSGKVDHIQKKIHGTIKRITKIVQGLKALSRNATGEPASRVSVRDIVDETMGYCLEKFQGYGTDIEVREISEDLHVKCVAIQISQVLLNLLNNARDAIKDYDEQWIRVEAQDRDDMVDIIVTDSGKGIPQEVRDKMFQPFFTTKDVGHGTGLGLSVSRTIIESHDGRFFIDDKSPNTSFVIRLPKA